MKTKPPKQARLRYTPSTLALTARRELETHSIIWILQWKLSLAYGSDTQQGAEQSLDHMKNIVKTHLGHRLRHSARSWQVADSYEIYNTTSSWPLALTRTGELKGRLIVSNLQCKLILATGFDTHCVAEQSLDCMTFTIHIYALGSWKLTPLYEIYNTNSSWPQALTCSRDLKSC